MEPEYERDIVGILTERMNEPRRTIQVVVGPRQTGKTTAVRQMLQKIDMPNRFARASQDVPASKNWLRREWQEARSLARNGMALLCIDEIQLVSQWSSVVKSLWDEDTDNDTQLMVMLTGSSSLLLQRGLKESLTGRFEVIYCEQWDYRECRDAFGFDMECYLYFGGYPGAAEYINNEIRWLDYMQNSIVIPSVLKDVVSLDKVTKPALMEMLFTLGASYSGNEISYRKLMGQLDDAGNATTIAHYLDLLSDAGLLTGIQKYSAKLMRTRASSPRLMVHDTSLMVSSYGPDRPILLSDPDQKGHLVESAVGAYLLRRSKKEHYSVYWWRGGNKEVDFVIQSGNSRTAIEVKSGKIKRPGGLDEFEKRFPCTKSLVVCSSTCTLEDFLSGDIPLF